MFCVPVLDKTWIQALSRCCRATTAKKCTKKAWCTCKVVVLLIKPIAFLPFSLPSASSLLNGSLMLSTCEPLGSLSSDVFERRTSTGSEVFSLLTSLDDIKFVFLSFFTTIEAIWLKICAKPPSKNEKRSLPVDVRRSKTLLLKLPVVENEQLRKHSHIFVNLTSLLHMETRLLFFVDPLSFPFQLLRW